MEDVGKGEGNEREETERVGIKRERELRGRAKKKKRKGITVKIIRRMKEKREVTLEGDGVRKLKEKEAN